MNIMVWHDIVWNNEAWLCLCLLFWLWFSCCCCCLACSFSFPHYLWSCFEDLFEISLLSSISVVCDEIVSISAQRERMIMPFDGIDGDDDWMMMKMMVMLMFMLLITMMMLMQKKWYRALRVSPAVTRLTVYRGFAVTRRAPSSRVI